MSSDAHKTDIEIIPEFAEGIDGQSGYGIRIRILNKGSAPTVIKEWGIVTPDRKYVNFLEWDPLSIAAGGEHMLTCPSGGFEATIRLMVKKGHGKKIKFYFKDLNGKYHYEKYASYEEFLELNR